MTARHRCACRPGCLTWLNAGDVITETTAGPALAAHVGLQPYPGALDEQDTKALNEVAS